MAGVTRGSSPQLVGRGAELHRLRDALRRAREADRYVVLVSGEAGIGKSRLIAEFRRSLDDEPLSDRPAVVLAASCLDVGGRLAYLPVIEVLEKANQLGDPWSATARELRNALGGTFETARAEAPSVEPTGRAATFLGIRDLLAGAAVERELVLVIDDLHWADRSTLDVIAFLARRLVGAGVLLVLAYRSDEMGRRHPLRPLVADLERHASLDHLRLEPLTAIEVRAQVASILGGELERARLNRVVQLADGNPFHVEELLSLEDDRRLPPSLREVLEARLDQLDDGTRRVVDQAAVIGRRVDTILLAAVSEVSRAVLLASLRRAIDTRILVAADDGRHYLFRHALLREAVYEDLSPIDRAAAHRRIAEALTEHPELEGASPAVATADRARHWVAARAGPEAFATLMDAARSAMSASAWAEATAALEEVVDLWDRIDEPVAVARMTRSAILEQAAEMAWYDGDARRAVSLNRRAQAESDLATDPHREAGFLDDLGDLAGEGDAARRAFSLLPNGQMTIDRAAALSSLGLHALRRGRVLEAAKAFEEAVAVAEVVGSRSEWAANVTWLALAQVNLAQPIAARDAIRRLDATLPEIESHLAWSVVTTWTPWLWIGMADYEHGIEYADRLLLDARSRGLDRGVGLWCLAPRALAELWLGRWDDALATIDRQGDYTWGIDAAVYLRSVAAIIAAGRDDPSRARSLAAEAIEIARSGFPEWSIVGQLAAAWVELLDEHVEAGLDHARAAWALAAEWDGLILRSQVLWIGLWAAADVAARSRSRDDSGGLRAALEFGDELAAAVGEAIDALPADTWPSTAGALLVLELAAAEAARIRGDDDAATWRSLADRLEHAGEMPRGVLARQRLLEALLRHGGDRSEAATAVLAIRRAAEAMAAPRLSARAIATARAARLKFDTAGSPTAPVRGASLVDRWGLSRRELEVLGLLAVGRTNRQIGEALFISDKTASVHVTHIMEKLGVSRRTEAAILAVRAGVGVQPGEIRESVAAE